MSNYFEELSQVNVNDKTEQKNGLTYLSWAFAVAEVTRRYPEMTYKILKFENNLPYVYDENTGYMVFTEVSIGGITKEMWLPVMNSANKAMKKEPYTYTIKGWNGKPDTKRTVLSATMFDINKTIMRCLVKNFAMFGLGLYIYAGEDIPENEAPVNQSTTKTIDKTKQDVLRIIAKKKEVKDIKAILSEKGYNLLKEVSYLDYQDILEKFKNTKDKEEENNVNK